MTVLKFDLNIFICIQFYFAMTSIFHYTSILPLYFLLLCYKTDTFKVNHFRLVCSIFICNYTNIFLFELPIGNISSSWNPELCPCHFIEETQKWSLPGVVICHHLKLPTHKWKASIFITYPWSQAFCYIHFFFSTVFKKTTIAFPLLLRLPSIQCQFLK